MRIRDGRAVVLLPVSIVTMLVACPATSFTTDPKLSHSEWHKSWG